MLYISLKPFYERFHQSDQEGANTTFIARIDLLPAKL